jgi:Zn-dependent metalloprotease
MYKITIKLLLLSAAVVFASNLSAFRADDDSTSLQSKSAAPALKAIPPRMPTAEQKAAARSLTDAKVEWDAKTGVPASIRGKDLAARNLGGKNLSLSAKNDFAADAVTVMDRLTALYRLRDAAEEFMAFRVDADEIGFHHARLNQKYKGLTVVGGEMIVHFNKAGAAYQVNGSYIPDINIDTQASIREGAAVQAAQNDLVKTGKPAGALKGKVKLVVYARDIEPVLAYELILVYESKEAGMGCWRYWVNANNGAIINCYNDIRKSDATISGTLNAGEGGAAVSVTGDYSSSYYWLRNTAQHWEIYDYPNSRVCRSSTATWGTSTSLRSEMSAAYNFYKILAYYSAVHSCNSYDNAGTKAVVNDHMSGGTDNAYWDPSAQQFFFYPGSSYGELTVLDVCGHEFTHAVTEKTANLVYQYESGALNESFSDIFGACIEFNTQPDGRSNYPNKAAGTADWLLAEDCAVSETAMRDMRDPQRYNNPSKYHGTDWYYGSGDNGGVHYNSGVQNHFFYLLCEGGSGSNDGISYNITGIGVTNARLVAYRALTVYCTQNTGYSAARTAWISAAQDLNSSWGSTVQAAWAAVGVTESTPSPTSVQRAMGLNNDFDGDNVADYALYDYLYGEWYIFGSSQGWMAYAAYFGDYGYLPVPGDYDGNGKADVVDYSPSTAWWLIYYVGRNVVDAFQWGSYYCIPAPGDYDGDGKSDFALYNFVSGQWYIFLSATLTWLTYGDVFGGYGYLPVPGDYNGGGKSDLVVYSETDAMWYLIYTETLTFDYLYFGGAGYVPAPGDFDYDGVTDFSLYDYYYGYWYIWSATQGWIAYDFGWGGYYYTPVAGDYDGDCISDLAVYSPYYGDWYFYYMGTGNSAHLSNFGGYYYVPIIYWSLYWYMYNRRVQGSITQSAW